MARDSMQPWMDRISLGEIEGMGVSPRSALGARDWDGHDSAAVSLAFGRPANPDISVLPVAFSREVEEDTAGGADDFDFTVASY
jgi:hypothetical protein